MDKLDFARYDGKLDIGALREQGIEAVLEELRYTRRLYEAVDAIIENSKDGFFITDENADVIKINRAYEEMAGVRREEILGKNMKELEHVTISKSASLMVQKTGEPVTIEQEYLRTGRTVYITSTPIKDENGNIQIIVSNNRDFREIDQLKNQLEETRSLVAGYEEKIQTVMDTLKGRSSIIAKDRNMCSVLYQANRVAKTDATVLILGETGTGKEEIAKFIHENSHRSHKPFVKLNCGAISSNLIESELFGYVKGAFTGAISTGKAGYFEIADGGTIFLDEIGEMPLELQVKLLRVLQEGELVRIGGTQPVKVNVRVLAATNRDLKEMVADKTFREDLYYRLNVIRIQIPPLRERPDDIIPLADHFLKYYNEKFHDKKVFSINAYEALRKYQWPGNVRELKNYIEQVVILSEQDILSMKEIMFNNSFVFEGPDETGSIDLKEILEKIEYEYMEEYYSKFGTIKLAAEKLGMNFTTYARRKKYFEEKYGD